jgi:hypothetical protein
MARTVRLSLPSRAVPVLTWLAELDDEEFLALRDAVADDETIESRTALGERFDEAISNAPDGRGRQLVNELFGFLGLHFTHGWAIEEIAYKASADGSLSLDGEQRENLKDRLVELTKIPIVNRLARAFDGYGNHQNLLHLTQILTDARPVFDDSLEGEVVGVIITHTIKIDYHSASGRQEIYITLDADDLEELEEAVARAKREAGSLAKFMKSASLTDLSRSAE